MKINIIIPSFYPATVYGGPIYSTLNACKALTSFKEIEIYVSTTNANKDKKLDVTKNTWVKFSDRFEVKYYNETIVGRLSFSLVFNIWRDIITADLVHLQGVFSTPTPVSLIYSFFLRKPVLLSPRGSLCEWGIKQGSRFKRIWLYLFIKPFASTIYWHATSATEKNDILKIFPKATVFIINNGIDTTTFRHINFLSKKNYLKKFTNSVLSPTKIIVSMGRLHNVKGFDILIKSFHELIKQVPKAVLLIAGDDDGEKHNLECLIEQRKLSESIFLVGVLVNQEKIDFLANADLFVLPSHTENFGNVYLESLAAGTPVIASKNTPWEFLAAADCGKWVKNTIADTSSAMIEMLQKDRDLMRINSKKLAEKFDWNTIAVKFKDVFSKILN